MEKNLTKNIETQNITQDNNFDSIKITLASPEKIKFTQDQPVHIVS